jgi:hypothetical protein
MPTLLRKFDLVRMYGVCMAIWPVAFALMPGLNILARLSSPVDLASAALPVIGASSNNTLAGVAREIANTALEASGAVHEGLATTASRTTIGPLVWLGIAVILFLARCACIAYS